MQCNIEGQRLIRSLLTPHTYLNQYRNSKYSTMCAKNAFQFNKMKAALLSGNETALCRKLPERNFRKVTPTIVRGFTVNVFKGFLLVNPLIISSTVHIIKVTDNEKSMHARGFSSHGLPSPMA